MYPLAVLPQLVFRGFHGGRERGSPPVVRHDAQRRPVPRGAGPQRGKQVRRQRLGIERAAVRPAAADLVEQPPLEFVAGGAIAPAHPRH